MKNWRANLIFGCFILFAAILIGRLAYVQIAHGDYYKAWAQGLHNVNSEYQAPRGEIFLKNDESLAINKNFPYVFVSPLKIEDFEKTAETLSGILNLDKELIIETIQQDNLFVPLKDKLTGEEVNNIEKVNLPGVYLNEERGRYYPKEDLASQVVGFLSAEGEGQYGLEEYYDSTLRAGEMGTDLVLTIDYNIQFESEKLLKAAKENLKIESGQIIVMEPSTGKIVALASFPSFDPNQYEEYAEKGYLDIFQNAATQKFFEPGSVFKPVTMAAALNEEKITPQTTYIDEGILKIDGWPIRNYDNRTYGEMTMTGVLEKSINTGAVFAQRQVGGETFLEYLDKLGIFSLTGIDLPESYSDNKEVKNGRDINFATASFGQGIMMTPIQLIKAYCALVNGGTLVKPYLVEKTTNSEKTTIIQPQLSEPIFSQKTSSQLAAMLISVVENGYAKSARIPGYYVAGKTGTAQVPFASIGIDKSGYSDKTWQSFMGFAPAFNPRFIILVKLDNPDTKTAEYSAVPIFHDLAKYIIDYWQIPPDYQ